MDNKFEVSKPSENPEIPEDWDFPERNEPGLKIEQLELSQNFLAFSLPNRPESAENKYYKGEYGDCFFDADGRKFQYRTHTRGESYIILKPDSQVVYYIQEFGPWTKPPDRKALTISYSEIELNVKSPDYIREESDIQGLIYYDTEDNLYEVGLGGIFATDKEGIIIESPVAKIRILKGSEKRLDIESWKYNQASLVVNMGFSTPRIIPGKNNAVYIIGSGLNQEKIFEVEWNIERGENEGGKSKEYLVVSQAHIPSGTVKILRSPLKLDMQKIEAAAYSKPPYPKDEKGRLVVPWRNIDRIVGASLSYSYPPLIHKKT